jgi:hypothetical protein
MRLPAANYVPLRLWPGDFGLRSLADLAFITDGMIRASWYLADRRWRSRRKCCAISLAQLKAACGDIDRLVRVVKLVGFVKPLILRTSQNVNGASDFMVATLVTEVVMRVSCRVLPACRLVAAVEIEAIFQIK